MNPTLLASAAAAGFLVSGAAAFHSELRRVASWGLFGAGILTLVAAAAALVCACSAPVHATLVPGLLEARFGVDALAAWGLLLLGLVACATSIAAPRLLNPTSQGMAGPTMAFLGFLFASILAVLTARQGVAFLVAWELMTLAGYGLIQCGPAGKERANASLRYLILSHLGVSGLFVGIGSLYAATGTFDFDAYHSLAETHPHAATVAFLGATWAFAFKAGLFPFHVWLPDAYVSAPAPATAAMSGIMSKTAAFWMLRFVFEFFGPGPAFWGFLLLGLGLVAAVFGILFALQQEDLKRLLAYSSIENLGLVFVGIGAATLLLSHGVPDLAALAAAASVLHMLNHGAYKSLLLLGAGSVEASTGTRRLDQLGGLARRMPWVAAFFLFGAVAITGLPPLNGFASEWLLFQVLVGALHAGGLPAAAAAASAAVVLGLVGGLAVATFVKAQGAAFHGQPRSPEAQQGSEASMPVLAVLGGLAAACLGLAASAPLLAVRIQALFSPTASSSSPSPLRIHVVGDYSPLVALGGFIAVTLLLWGVTMGARPHRGPVWACGLRLRSPRATHTGRALADALATIFRPALRPQRVFERHLERDGTFRRPIQYAFHVGDAADQAVYGPVTRAVLAASRRLRIIQAGSIRLYLGYILLILVGLLAFVAVKP